MNVARNAAEVLAEHTTLELECIDRLYLNVYVALLQSPAGVSYFFSSSARPSGSVVGIDGADDAALRQRVGTLRPARGGGPDSFRAWRTQG